MSSLPGAFNYDSDVPAAPKGRIVSPKGAPAQPNPLEASTVNITSSPAKRNRFPADSAVQPDAPYNSSSFAANVERRQLGFASLEALKQRVTAVMYDGHIADEDGVGGFATRFATTETIQTQTEDVPIRDIGVGVTDDAIVRERTEELELGLCDPHDLPVMAVSQLLEAERRLSDLLNRLEAEISRAEAQERRQQEEDELAKNANSLAAMNGGNGFFETTDDWTKRFASRIDRRLRRRHGDPDGVTPAVFWHRAKTELIASPPRAHMLHTSPERSRATALAAMAPDPTPSPLMTAATPTPAAAVGVRPTRR